MLAQIFPLTTLLFSLVSGQTTDITVDPCSKISGKPVVGYKDVLACYDNFKLSDKVQIGVSDTIKKILPFYAFVDISNDSPEPQIPSNKDIESDLNRILTKKYTTERDFQTSIVKYFASLNDGHTEYSSSCFTSYTFRQPFPIYTEVGESGEVKVKIPQDLKYSQSLLDAWKAAGVDVLGYAGAEVLAINDKKPLEFIQEYVNENVGVSRDINSRINLALARSIQRNGQWGINYGLFASTTFPPAKETLTFTIKDGNNQKTVTVPYIAIPNVANTFTNSNTFYKSNCLPGASDRAASNNNNKIEILEVPRIRELPIEAPLKSLNSRLADPLTEPAVDGTYVKTYILPNNVGVVHISTFSPTERVKWFTEILSGFETLQNQGVEKLILDVSNNGGGYICLGYNVLDYLFPNATTKYFNTDMHYSPLLAKLTQDPSYGFFSPRGYNQPDGKKFASNDAFTEIKTYRRGFNPNSKYTPQFQESCSSNPLRALLKDGKQPFKTENIALVSNSICYSTCTLLSNGLQEFHNVKSYAFGGLKDKDATIGSLAGGTVYSLDGLLDNLEASGLSKDPAAPQPFPTKSGIRFTVREAYSSRFKELRPLEFTWNPAKIHKSYDAETAFNPYKIWEQVARDL